MAEEILLAWDAERKCDYCDKVFAPTRPQDAHQKFCCPNHRKDFFKYGAKLKTVAAVSRFFEPRFSSLEKRLVWLEKKLAKPAKGLDKRREKVVTFKPEEQRSDDGGIGAANLGGAGQASGVFQEPESQCADRVEGDGEKLAQDLHA
jgi:hypothetical protein